MNIYNMNKLHFNFKPRNNIRLKLECDICKWFINNRVKMIEHKCLFKNSIHKDPVFGLYREIYLICYPNSVLNAYDSIFERYQKTNNLLYSCINYSNLLLQYRSRPVKGLFRFYKELEETLSLMVKTKSEMFKLMNEIDLVKCDATGSMVSLLVTFKFFNKNHIDTYKYLHEKDLHKLKDNFIKLNDIMVDIVTIIASKSKQYNLRE